MSIAAMTNCSALFESPNTALHGQEQRHLWAPGATSALPAPPATADAMFSRLRDELI
jgi:hypothetical protein